MSRIFEIDRACPVSGPFQADPIVNVRGDPLFTALVGRDENGHLQVAIPLDLDANGNGRWIVSTWSDGEARDTLAALDAFHQGGGTA